MRLIQCSTCEEVTDADLPRCAWCGSVPTAEPVACGSGDDIPVLRDDMTLAR
jgi:hypothetical protein